MTTLNISSTIQTAAGPFTLNLTAAQVVGIVTTGVIPTGGSSLGHDLACIQDEDPGQSEVDGWPCLAQALVRRLQTPQGMCLGDPDYGYDLIGEIDDDIDLGTAQQIGAAIDAEFLKDQRVQSSSTLVQLVGT